MKGFSRPYHISVMPNEVRTVLDLRPGLRVCDLTLGGGGHAQIIAKGIEPGGTLIVFDQDSAAFDEALPKLAGFEVELIPVRSNFRKIVSELEKLNVGHVDRIFADLALSSRQLDDPSRGFSFNNPGLLDMRQDLNQKLSANQLLATLTEREIRQLLVDFGDEAWSARIAKFIVEARSRAPITTTQQLKEIVEAAVPKAAWPKNRHPATLTFQALRVVVNDEKAALAEMLEGAFETLAPGGIFAAISFQGDEDKAVKDFMASKSGKCVCPPKLPVCVCGAVKQIEALTKKPLTPSDAEIAENSRSRSARLRAYKKL